MVTLASDTSFDNQTLVFYITEDLSDVLMTITAGSDALDISAVQVVLSYEYYNELTKDGSDFSTIENMDFTVIGFEDTSEIASSALENVTFSLMYYTDADELTLAYYEDKTQYVADGDSTTLFITDDDGSTLFTLDTETTDLYGGNGSESADITESVYTYYVGKYSFVAGASSIPEPSTATLSLLALAGFCARRRRRS